MIPRYRVYLFDIDGTLTDSAPDICGAIQSVLSLRGIDNIPVPLLRSFIGRHLTDTFTHVNPAFTQAETDELIADYRRIYAAREHALTTLYPSVAETLAALPGRKTTATTKGTSTARIVLDKFGLLPHFEHVQGTDGFPHKPAPDVIHRALAALEASPSECLFVGDATTDIEAGHAAGVDVCAVTYGYGDPAALAALRPRFTISSLPELLG
ncbi:MAG: HAD-IA family hydrolase [Bryobacteraceae bacterium]|nr:HAD-IA family hydrolase [Bryobacteraceae bacterium]